MKGLGNFILQKYLNQNCLTIKKGDLDSICMSVTKNYIVMIRRLSF